MCIARTHSRMWCCCRTHIPLCVCACESRSLTIFSSVCVCNSRLCLGPSTTPRGRGQALAICSGRVRILSCISSVTPLRGPWGGGAPQFLCKICLALSEHNSASVQRVLLQATSGLRAVCVQHLQVYAVLPTIVSYQVSDNQVWHLVSRLLGL